MGRSNGHKDSMQPIITLLFPATHLSEESQGLWKETLRSRQDGLLIAGPGLLTLQGQFGV